MYVLFQLLVLCFTSIRISSSENVQTTKVFIIEIQPSMFNWTLHSGDDFEYQASLLNAPDLPKWIEYQYSRRHHSGFLYGVPPRDQKDIEIVKSPFHCPRACEPPQDDNSKTRLQIEIIALNRRTYETRRRIIHMNVENKINPATHEVHLKIDNLNVEDLFDPHKRARLLDIFKFKLWKESFGDLYETFLTSAVTLGARRPLRPNDGEGVVLKLGSEAEFSNTLLELQEEVRPLYKIQPCPRDFKRTSVERLFREQDFILDWCNFKLVNDTSYSSEKTTERIVPKIDSPALYEESIWSRPTKDQVSERSYAGEFAFTILIPMIILILLVILLSFILGFQREGLRDESDEFFDNVFRICEDYARSKRNNEESDVQMSQYAAVQRATTALREMTLELNGTTRSRTTSPHVAVRSAETNGLSRPTPPPYSAGTMRTAVVDF